MTEAARFEQPSVSIVPPSQERTWRCHFCGRVAVAHPISGSDWVDILVHSYHPVALEACPKCWEKMAERHQEGPIKDESC